KFKALFAPPRSPPPAPPHPGRWRAPRVPPQPAGAACSQAARGAARLSLGLDRRRRMGEGRVAVQCRLRVAVPLAGQFQKLLLDNFKREFKRERCENTTTERPAPTRPA